MSLDIVWEQEAARAMARLTRRDTRLARRIFEAIDQYAANASGDLRKLQGRAGEWRLRIGTWRVIFAIDENAGTMHVLHVAPRNEAYE
jgi:mRNA-degrading endonuclease RelE of RelBE toxin-antitoxin system